MKTLLIVLTVLLVAFAAPLKAEIPAGYTNEVTSQVVENLLEGLKSDNLGLKLSSAYYLGEYGCSEAVIPLLRVLKSDTRLEARISAAVALYKIDDARGIYAVKEAIKFDHSKRVRKICTLLYNEHLKPAVQKIERLALK